MWSVSESVGGAHRRRDVTAFRVKHAPPRIDGNPYFSAPTVADTTPVRPADSLMRCIRDRGTHCAPLLAALLARDPTLASEIAARALATAKLGALRQQPGLSGLVVDDAAATWLLEGGNQSPWVSAMFELTEGVATGAPQPELVGELWGEHPRLRAAALAPEVLLEAIARAGRGGTSSVNLVFLLLEHDSHKTLGRRPTLDATVVRELQAGGREHQSFRRLVMRSQQDTSSNAPHHSLVEALVDRASSLDDTVVDTIEHYGELSGDEEEELEDDDEEEEGEDMDDEGEGGDGGEGIDVAAMPIGLVTHILQQLGQPTDGTEEELRARLLAVVANAGGEQDAE